MGRHMGGRGAAPMVGCHASEGWCGAWVGRGAVRCVRLCGRGPPSGGDLVGLVGLIPVDFIVGRWKLINFYRLP